MKIVKTLLAASLVFSASSAFSTVWEQIRTPVNGEPQSIGGYSNGCIIGAQPLALRGEGYQVIRAQKNRFYGHPDLLGFIQRLSKNAKSSGLPPLLIGDMGMAAGGRFSSGHASHQTGLDVDIWLRFGPLTDQQAQTPTATLMVNREAKVVDESVWTPQQTEMIRLAAKDPRVDRIFLNPAIKVKLCNSVRGDRAWLQKIRPWHGHDAHMHVRLGCPANATNCENQAPIPAGDGCGAELYSWFEPATGGGSTKPKALPQPPQLCQMILSNQGLN